MVHRLGIYSRAKDGEKKLAEHFTVKEFACHDGSDYLAVDSALVDLLEKVREHFGKPVVITSAYRSAAYNAKIGGVSNSKHCLGLAADIKIADVSPVLIAQYLEYLIPGEGGIGLYNDSKSGYFVHVDTRTERSRWRQVNGKETGATGFPGYVERKEGDTVEKKEWYEDFAQWAKNNGISDGTRPGDGCTRAEAWTMLYMLYKLMKGEK